MEKINHSIFQKRNVKRRTGLVMLGLMFILGFISTGCEEDVNPFVGTDLPFTVWGFVNPKADTHAVRVFTIDEVLRLIPEAPLDATVSIISVDDTQRYILRDSTILLPTGEFRHIFWSAFPVDFDETYRLEVERSDGLVTKSTDVTVPAPVSIDVLEPNLNSFTELILPLQINGDPPSMPRIDAEYATFAVDGDGNRLQDNHVLVSYANKPVFKDGNWQLDLDLREDFLTIRENFTDNEITGFICMDTITLNIHVVNEEWRSPTGTFDPDFLVEPGTLTNVENGFGLFGAGYIETISWMPPSVMQVRAGFFDCGGG